jgi:hypothetical protein
MKYIYDRIFDGMEIDHCFCSVLIRTWCTAWILFMKRISEFQIAPHLRESASGYTNNPFPFATNVNRFAFFKEYVKRLTNEDNLLKSLGEGQPGYALMNKAFTNYSSDFVANDEIGIDKFMQWYITNENALGRNNKAIRNVVVVCHSDLLKTFCDDHLTPSERKERKMDESFFKKTHTYCIKIQVRMPEIKSMPILQNEHLTMKNRAIIDAPPFIPKNTLVLGGNKHKIKKTKKNKLNKHKFKKTIVRKTRRGGGIGRFLNKSLFGSPNKFYFVDSSGKNGSYVTNLPFEMTIKTIIEGTRDIPRFQKNQPNLPPPDCICSPDAYKENKKTFECADKNRENDFAYFTDRHKQPPPSASAPSASAPSASAPPANQDDDNEFINTILVE